MERGSMQYSALGPDISAAPRLRPTFALQLKAVIYKKWFTITRSPGAIAVSLVFPVILMVAAVVVPAVVGGSGLTPSPLYCRGAKCPAQLAVVSGDGVDVGFRKSAAQSKGLLGNFGDATSDRPVSVHYASQGELQNHILGQNASATPYTLGYDVAEASVEKRRFSYTVLVTNTSVVLDRTQPQLVLRMGVAMMGEAVMRTVQDDDTSASARLPVGVAALPPPADSDTLTGGVAFIFYGPLLLQLGFLFVIPMFGLLLVKERELNLTDFLRVNGLSQWAFWVGTLLVDFATHLALPSLIFFIVVYASGTTALASTSAVALVFFVVVYSMNAVIFAAIVSLPFKKYETAGRWLFSLVTIIGVVFSMVALIVATVVGPKSAARDAVNYIFALLFPPHGLSSGLTELLLISAFSNGAPVTTAKAFDLSLSKFPIFFILQFVQIAIMAALLAFFERLRGADVHVCNRISQFAPSVDYHSWDPDVTRESDALRDGAGKEEAAIYVSGIGKGFVEASGGCRGEQRVKYAVKDVSFRVPEGSVFCLLGSNGAGKSTLVSMLTGRIRSNRGSASIYGLDVFHERERIYPLLGVCPQFDVVYDFLTTEQVLRMFGMIRGLQGAQLEATVDDIIEQLDLQEFRQRRSGKLSGGCKRRLSVGVALMGNPRLLILDEPSSALDPKARRALWEVINSRKRAGVSVLLVTHSMAEADALSDALGMMVSGELRALGTRTHLKAKFGSGLRISFVLAPQMLEERGAELDRFMQEQFPHSAPEKRLLSQMTYTIPAADNVSVADVLRRVSEIRQQVPVQEYFVSASSLDDVFINLTNEQARRDEAEMREAGKV